MGKDIQRLIGHDIEPLLRKNLAAVGVAEKHVTYFKATQGDRGLYFVLIGFENDFLVQQALEYLRTQSWSEYPDKIEYKKSTISFLLNLRSFEHVAADGTGVDPRQAAGRIVSNGTTDPKEIEGKIAEIRNDLQLEAYDGIQRKQGLMILKKLEFRFFQLYLYGFEGSALYDLKKKFIKRLEEQGFTLRSCRKEIYFELHF